MVEGKQSTSSLWSVFRKLKMLGSKGLSSVKRDRSRSVVVN